MPYEITVRPTAEPFTIEELKRQARLYSDITDEDVVLVGYIAGAREHIEREAELLLAPCQIQARSEGWPDGDEWLSPVGPLRSIESVEYRDEDGQWQTLDQLLYEAVTHRHPGGFALLPDAVWPRLGRYKDPVRVTAQAGFSEAAAIPRTLRIAVLMQAAYLYDKRIPINDRTFYPLTRSVEDLINLNRHRWL